ncbi:Urb2/Npa2 family-domain-containing protein [Mycena belliarum]|uniref:Urb2/Npa2 family-domain-containing protein n=1 Tax=Mycena belliarum TaxID=1033014 RepID=A0AAD6UMR0_9AGAR|nr:Urb2/Npa2 family-domain-containing protein [Mycena belliae]
MASQAVYHALKAPSDPPTPGGPLKVQIASAAWADTSLYMPNKGEVIAEWVLTRLLKDKEHLPESNPVLDPRFWSLLSDIVSDQSKPVKHWLLPLLNRVPLAPVVVSFLELYKSAKVEIRGPLTSVATKSLVSIWPFAVHKISAETLLECFGTFMGVTSAPKDLERLGTVMISSLRTSVANSSNKKKLWFVLSSDHAPSALQESVYNAGIETMFNVDTLRQVHNEDHPFFLALQSITGELVQPMLPRIFSSFVQNTKKYRNALFAQGSGHTPAAVTKQVHEASFSFFDSCEVLFSAADLTPLMWEARLGLLTVVEEEHLFNSNQLEEQTSLKAAVPLILSVLKSEAAGNCTEQAASSLACLSKLMQIDSDLILGDLHRILPNLLRISDPFPSALGFLELVLEYHVKTRTMDTHIESLFAALNSQPETSVSDIQQQYRCSSSGALLHPTHLERFAKSTEKFLTSTQTVHVVRFVLETLDACWNQILAVADIDTLAVTFSSGARLASVILSALPLRALPPTTLNEVDDLVNEIRTKFLARALSKTLKMIRKSDSWGWQIITAALLRLAYAMDTPYVEKLWSKIDTATEHGHLLPELSLELHRILLKWSPVDEPTRTQSPMDRLLNYLENNCGPSETSWSGASYSLTSGREGQQESVLAIMHMLIDRWLPTIDAIASSAQLQRFIRVLVTTTGTVSVSRLTKRSASNGISAAILAFADKTTSSPGDPSSSTTADSRAAIFSTFRLLLMFPVEYMPRTNRIELVKRAIHADIHYDSAANAEDAYSNITVLRLFIQNISLHVEPVDQPPPQAYTTVSLSLVGLYLSALLKSPEQESAQATLAVLRSCLSSDALSLADQSSILVCLLSLLTTVFSPSNFRQEMQAELSNLQQRLSTALVSHAEELDDLFARDDVMNLWLHCLSFGRWLKSNSDEMPLVGRKLCFRAGDPSFPGRDQLDRNCVTAFAILSEELQGLPNHDRLPQLGVILATYVSLTRLISQDGLSDTAQSADDMPHLIHMAALLLSEHPAGTLKHTQKFFTTCLNMFVGRDSFTLGPLPLRQEVLRLLRTQCSDNAASLRTLDIGCIWLLLSRFLTKSKEHDDKTCTALFHEIALTIGALIRLRRDLVSLTLPNLAFVLQQLIATIRRPRPQLGAKQTALVTDSLPLWVNSAYPMRPEEGKALARLLETLTTKTTIRTNSSTADAQQAQSLARSFSKHAAYTLKAYIDAMNDPLCILSSELRKELRPGLFALCSMLNDHSRDAMMVSALDAGGKTIMKSLWTEYERQKYVGKG